MMMEVLPVFVFRVFHCPTFRFASETVAAAAAHQILSHNLSVVYLGCITLPIIFLAGARQRGAQVVDIVAVNDSNQQLRLGGAAAVSSGSEEKVSHRQVDGVPNRPSLSHDLMSTQSSVETRSLITPT